MRYILTENKLNESIYNFIDEMFNTDYINYFHPEDDYGNGNDDPYRCLFYFNDYSDEETLFRWYDKEYFNDDTEQGMILREESPIIVVEEPFYSRLDNLFGERWMPVFLKWFNENYPEYKSKTVGF